ncbi:MAG: hypothetical protein EBR82_23445 [Caulobacteraceae bacterium]|nr:hypothetical protein [Caulobacteraceae bacterium]
MKNPQGIEYQYYKAQLLGWNGSRSRVIAEASGCWDTEVEADKALDEEIERMSEAKLEGWQSDCQRFSRVFSVTPTIDGRLDHSSEQTLTPGEVPEFKVAADEEEEE